MSPDTRCCQHCQHSLEDHDLLIQIGSSLKQFLETVSDHEKRLRTTERWGWLAIGALFIMQVVIGYAIAMGRLK